MHEVHSQSRLQYKNYHSQISKWIGRQIERQTDKKGDVQVVSGFRLLGVEPMARCILDKLWACYIPKYQVNVFAHGFFHLVFILWDLFLWSHYSLVYIKHPNVCSILRVLTIMQVIHLCTKGGHLTCSLSRAMMTIVVTDIIFAWIYTPLTLIHLTRNRDGAQR